MPLIRLIHWKSSEARVHIHILDEAGFGIEYDEQFHPRLMQRWRESPPDAFVIDLSRLPSHGREIAIALRQHKLTRTVPIVFCDGDSAKIAAIRELLPDAAYCELRKLVTTIKHALAAPPVNPARPLAMMERYASRTAAQKLGIKEGSSVAVLNPPRDYATVLGPLPASVEIIETDAPTPNAQVHVCFLEQADELADLLSELRSIASQSKLWVAWRKSSKAERGERKRHGSRSKQQRNSQASWAAQSTQAGFERVAQELNEIIIRRHALDLGLVDYKVCSLNSTWSALLFALKRSRA